MNKTESKDFEENAKGKIRMIGTIPAIYFCFLMAVLVTCKSPTSPNTNDELTITITGVVTDSKTGQVLSAKVEVYGGSWNNSQLTAGTSTDSQGKYTLTFKSKYSECYEGKYHLYAEALGYEYQGGPYGWETGYYAVKCITDVQIHDFQLDEN